MIERDSNSFNYGSMITLNSRDLLDVNESDQLANSSIVKCLYIIGYGCLLMAILIVAVLLIMFIFGIVEANRNPYSQSLMNLNY